MPGLSLQVQLQGIWAEQVFKDSGACAHAPDVTECFVYVTDGPETRYALCNGWREGMEHASRDAIYVQLQLCVNWCPVCLYIFYMYT